AGNPNLLEEIGEVAKSVFARGRRGEDEARGRYEFKVMADKGEQQRKVTIDISMAEIHVRVKGVAPQDGRDGILREIGDYVKHTRPQEAGDKDTVNHYLTGKFAPAREGEALVMIDNSLVRGINGIDCLGHTIPPKAGAPCQIQTGKGIRKKLLAPGKFQLVANRTGVARPVYDKEDKLCAIDVLESVHVSEVSLREGGHVAIRGTHGQASELEVEDTLVDSVGRAFSVRTTGTVNVRETIYGEVLAGEIKARMINAENKLIAARDTIRVASAVQTSVLRAPIIAIGQGANLGSLINSTCRARQTFSANNVRFLGRNTIILGNDQVREEGAVLCGADLFADRQQILNEQRSLQQQGEDLTEELRQGLLRQVKMQNNVAGTDHRTLLQTIAAGEKAYGRCSVEEEEQLTIKLNNALTDLGVRDTLAFLNLFSTKKQLREKLKKTASRLKAISPPLSIKLHGVDLNDGAQLTIRCWRDTLHINRIEKKIIIKREQPEEELFSGRSAQFSLEISFDYQSGKLACSALS
ncbi:MAG: FapA family protein, partial [Desulfobulbaceae bacterium]|nr:FapA family protein [Desulfobulbaceae bacterium]